MSDETRWSINSEPVLTDGLLLALYEYWQEYDHGGIALPDEKNIRDFIAWLLLKMPARTPETEAEKQLIAMLRSVEVT